MSALTHLHHLGLPAHGVTINKGNTGLETGRVREEPDSPIFMLKSNLCNSKLPCGFLRQAGPDDR